ncbi:TPA: collagen binding domain-containing protein, partial [Enterococcus faecium]
MRNKFHKLLSMFLVMLIVINQFGNITVLAESLAEQPERSLTIEVDQEEAALGEQFQLRVRGTPDLLNALVIDKSEDLIEGEVKQLNDYERLITYSSQHSGKYELTARSGDIQSNTVSIEISVPEESTSESFNVPEESTSESFNIPEESLSESFNEARSSEPSITQESQIERQEELLNYDIGISAERPTLPSRHTQTLKGYIQGGAGDILEEYGEMVVRVPRASIGLIEFIRVEVADDSPLKPLAFYQEGTDVVFPFTFDYEGLNEAAQSYTFSITFEVAFFQSGGTEPNNDFQVSLTYAERAANTEFSITPIPSSRPIFSKLYYGSREIDSQGNLGNLLIDGQDVTNSNKFILQVNYEGSRKDGVVVTDVLPQGTTLAPNPTTWSSTGNREPISGGVRIAEVTNPGEANVRTHYVSEEFVDKNVINLNENELTYTLHVSMFSGTRNTLVIEDVLEEGMEFVSFLSDIPSFIDAEVNNGIVRFSANNTIGGPTSFTLSFKVNVEAYAVGDQILNFATLVNSDNRLNTSTVRTRKIDGRIKVIKTDENGQRLAGAKFEILSSDSQVIQEGITAENGEFLSEPLPVGSYQVRETEAPEGYLLDATVHDVFINEYSIEEVTLTIENILDTGGVELIKHAEGSGEVLQGAVFELQNREGETLQTG